ncbi:hypothetical protein N798_13265 [Knoellia flava TL1]|uniref:Uncharacterized protein n=2 Tax=Knoellia flava TaxID=913969 RepID=A0A8H9FUZ4_9MICO|nr:hypothetical protein [Knoellia flava]KGN29616.1 hypothetical protein N798_13265 [Knoellia flava TL1]GGB75941.1 hypothetical protein GCM10011314_14380 [Knoellia flava]
MVVLLLGGIGTTIGVPAASAAVAPGECATAKALVEQGLPRRAQVVLAGNTPTECADEQASAASAKQLGEVLAATARGHLAKSQAPPAGDDARELAEAEAAATKALTHDKENEDAAAVLRDVKAQGSWTARLRDAWDQFWEDRLAPSVALLATLLAVFAVQLVLARLVALGRGDWTEPRAEPRFWRSLVRVGGTAGMLGGAVMVSVGLAGVSASSSDAWLVPTGRVLAVVAAGVALVAGGASRSRRLIGLTSVSALMGMAIVGALAVDVLWDVLDGSSPWRTPLWIVLSLLTGAVGVWLTAWLLATRLRLDVVVKGEDGSLSTTGVGTVVALLSELGAERTRGIEVPRGADVTALEGAFSTLPDNVVLRTLKGLLVSLGGVTPWTATIEGSATSRSVSIRRNGQAVDSAVIDVAALVPQVADDTTSDPATKTSTVETPKAATPEGGARAAEPDASLRLAAAFILMTLSTKHPKIREGLAGATRWESVGLQYIASADLAKPSDVAQRRAVLASALNRDPGNLSAQLAYRHALDRDSTDRKTLERYRDWLHTFESAEGLTRGLRLRATYTRAVIATNAAFAGGRATGGRAAIEEALDDYRKIANDVAADDPEDHLVEELEDRLQGLDYLVGRRAEKPTPNSPTGMYNVGCALASRRDLEMPSAQADAGKAADDPEAVVWLTRARENPLDRYWYLTDPQLAEFRKRAFFRNAFLPAPNDDFFRVAAVAPVRDLLRAAGIGRPRALAAALPSVVASAAQVDRARAAVLIRLAEVHESLSDYSGTTVLALNEEPARPLRSWAAELLDRFVAHGCTSLTDLGDLGDLGGTDARREFAFLVADDVHASSRPDDELPSEQQGEHWPKNYMKSAVLSRDRLRAALVGWLGTL